MISDAVVIEIQKMLFKRDIQHWMSESKILSLNHQWKLFITEDKLHFVYKINVIRQEASVYLNYKFKEKNQSVNDIQETYFVQYVVSLVLCTLCSLQLSVSLHNELKITAYDRDYFVDEFIFKKTLSLLFILFIDEFSLYQNIYQSLMKIYLLIAELSAWKWFWKINIFFLTLRSHDSQFSNVVAVLWSALTQLNREIKLTINEKKKLICAFMMTFIENMSQQQINSEFLS